MEIALVKAAGPGDRDRAYLEVDGVTPRGVRDRVARANDPSLQDLLARVDDETIATAIRGVRDLKRRWLAVPPGGKLKLVWPLARDFFAGAVP